jgi:hypothetical protein
LWWDFCLQQVLLVAAIHQQAVEKPVMDVTLRPALGGTKNLDATDINSL